MSLCDAVQAPGDFLKRGDQRVGSGDAVEQSITSSTRVLRHIRPSACPHTRWRRRRESETGAKAFKVVRQIRQPVIGLARSIARGVQNLLSFSARSEEHTSELQSLMRISYAVFC